MNTSKLLSILKPIFQGTGAQPWVSEAQANAPKYPIVINQSDLQTLMGLVGGGVPIVLFMDETPVAMFSKKKQGVEVTVKVSMLLTPQSRASARASSQSSQGGGWTSPRGAQASASQASPKPRGGGWTSPQGWETPGRAPRVRKVKASPRRGAELKEIVADVVYVYEALANKRNEDMIPIYDIIRAADFNEWTDVYDALKHLKAKRRLKLASRRSAVSQAELDYAWQDGNKLWTDVQILPD
jgi:hypothetical protein